MQTWRTAEAPGSGLELFAYLPVLYDRGKVVKLSEAFDSDAVVLRGYRLGSPRVASDEPVHLTLLWDDIPGRDTSGLRATVRLFEAATGVTWAQSTVRLRPSGLALDDDARLAQQVLLDPPDALPQGEYRIVVSLTEPSGRSVDVSGERAAFENGMVLATVVNPPDVSVLPIGMDFAASHQFGDGDSGSSIDLLGYDAPEREVPGAQVRIALLWSTKRPILDDYHVLVHLVSADAALVAQGDGVPVYGFFPTTTWAPGSYVRDEHILSLPEDLPRGDYLIYVGLYLVDTGERLPAYDGAGVVQPDGRVLLHTLAVR